MNNREKLITEIRKREKHIYASTLQSKIDNAIEYLKYNWPSSSSFPAPVRVVINEKTKTANVYYGFEGWYHSAQIKYDNIEDIYDQILSRNQVEFAKPIRPEKATPEKMKKWVKETFGIDPTD